MTYIIGGNPRCNMRGGSDGYYGAGGFGAAPPTGMGGKGNALDPFGGVGGASEAQLKKLVSGGLKFTSIKVQTGLVNGEKYVLAQGSDNMFYKFKMTNTGWGNSPADTLVTKWFSGVVAASSTAAVASSGGGVPIKVGSPLVPHGGLKAPPRGMLPGPLAMTIPGSPAAIAMMNAGGAPVAGGSGMSKNTALLVGGAALLALVVLSRR